MNDAGSPSPDPPEPSRTEPGSSRLALPFEQVVSLCEEFTRSWHPAQRPSISAYLGRVAEDWKEAVLRNLLQCELRRRRDAGEYPNADVARRNLAGSSDAVRFRISEGYGRALAVLGRYEDAKRELTGTLELADDPERKARIEALGGDILFKQGSMDGSIALTESGLRRLGVRVPRTTLGVGYGLVRETVIQAVHTLFPRRLHRAQHSRRHDHAVRLLWPPGSSPCVPERATDDLGPPGRAQPRRADPSQ